MTDGIFHTVFNEISAEYPEIASEHLIIDIGTALVADKPERFDVIVTTNLYGDIFLMCRASDRFSGPRRLGQCCNQLAMFEAIHGSAPDIAGKNIANPSGLLQGAFANADTYQSTRNSLPD